MSAARVDGRPRHHEFATGGRHEAGLGNHQQRSPRFLKGVVLGTAAVGAATTLFSDVERGSLGVSKAAAASENKKMAFIQWQPHTVPAAWSKGIEEVLKTQQTIDYELLDGQNKVEVQVSLLETLVEQGASVIFCSRSTHRRHRAARGSC
jgi:ABC-type sugar transport system substrate-binding protein